MLRGLHYSTNATRTRLFNRISSAYDRLMSKHDRFKEEIGWLKALCALFAASFSSILVWLVQNYETATRVTLLLASLALSALAPAIAASIFRLYRCFKILEVL